MSTNILNHTGYAQQAIHETAGVVAAQQSDSGNRYGMSEEEYQVYLNDCRESAEVYEDIYHFLHNDADVADYFY